MKVRQREHRIEKRIAQSEWRAKEPRLAVYYFRERTLRAGYFTIKGPRAVKCESDRMTITVVLHAVATEHDFLHKAGVTFRPLPNAKEGGRGGVTIEQLKYLRRYIRIGTVIERKRDMAIVSALGGQA